MLQLRCPVILRLYVLQAFTNFGFEPPDLCERQNIFLAVEFKMLHLRKVRKILNGESTQKSFQLQPLLYSRYGLSKIRAIRLNSCNPKP
jgi:hypothetical protein